MKSKPGDQPVTAAMRARAGVTLQQLALITAFLAGRTLTYGVYALHSHLSFKKGKKIFNVLVFFFVLALVFL